MSQVRKQAEAARQIAARELRAGNFINDSAFRVGNAANTGRSEWEMLPIAVCVFVFCVCVCVFGAC